MTLPPPCAGSSRGSAVISPEDDSLLTDRRPSSHRRTQDTNNTYIGEIDGRFSFSQGEDYVRVEVGRHGVLLGRGSGVL